MYLIKDYFPLIYFSIKDWFYWGTYFVSHEQNASVDEMPLELDNIPAIQRRRLPLIAKRINQFALSTKKKQIPVIYASAHGEISRTLSIIRDFDTDVSPMQFSLSVHNAIAGLLSVAHKNTQAYQTIDSLSGCIETAIVEAVGLLTQHEEVAVVYYDESLPDEYISLYHNELLPSTTVLAMTLTKGVSGDKLQLNKRNNKVTQYDLNTEYAEILTLVGFLKNNRQELVTTYASSSWHWKRK